MTAIDENSAVMALAALAQTSRLRVFRALVGAGLDGLQPGQLSQDLQVPPNTLSFHLKELHHANLVSVQREGRHMRYRANLFAMQSLMGFLTDHCCQGQACLPLPTMVCEGLTTPGDEMRTGQAGPEDAVQTPCK